MAFSFKFFFMILISRHNFSSDTSPDEASNSVKFHLTPFTSCVVYQRNKVVSVSMCIVFVHFTHNLVSCCCQFGLLFPSPVMSLKRLYVRWCATKFKPSADSFFPLQDSTVDLFSNGVLFFGISARARDELTGLYSCTQHCVPFASRCAADHCSTVSYFGS